MNIKPTLLIQYLSVHIASHLNCDEHKNFVFKFFSKKLLANYYNENHLKITYHTLIEIRLIFVARGATNQVLINKLEFVQKHTLKVIFKKSRRYSSDQFMTNLT